MAGLYVADRTLVCECGEELQLDELDCLGLAEGFEKDWSLDLILECEECHRTYNAFLPVVDLQLVEES